MLVHVILLLCLSVLVSATDEVNVLEQFFVCRLRVSNVSRETAERVRGQDFDPQIFSTSSHQPSLIWRSVDVGDDPTGAEVLYTADVPNVSQIAALTYPAISDISEDRITFHCSNGTAFNNTYGVDIVFTQSYNITLGPPLPSADGRIRRPATFYLKDRLDCYDRSGYLHAYDLNPVQRYVADGEYYELDCSSINKCTNGELSGFSRCPPHHSSDKYAEVRTVGECCEDAVEKAEVEAKGCPKHEEPSDEPNPIPWQVRFGNQDLQCDGVIISKHWFLTLASCIRDMQENIEFFRPHSIMSQPDTLRNVTLADWIYLLDNETTLNLALARINLAFVSNDWTTSVQKINLPWSKALCEMFLEPDCTILLGTDQTNSTKLVDSNLVAANPSVLKKTKETPYAERIRKANPWPVLRGGAAVSWFQKTYFLTGIYTSEGSNALGIDYEFGNMIRLCPYLDGIREHINKHEEPETKKKFL